MLRDPGAHPAYGMRSPASTTSAARDPVTGLDSLRSHAARQRGEMGYAPRKAPATAPAVQRP